MVKELNHLRCMLILKEIMLKQNFELLNNSVKNFQCLLDKIDKLHEKIDIIEKQPKEINYMGKSMRAESNSNRMKRMPDDLLEHPEWIPGRPKRSHVPGWAAPFTGLNDDLKFKGFGINAPIATRFAANKTEEDRIKDSKNRSNFNDFNNSNHWDSIFQ